MSYVDVLLLGHLAGRPAHGYELRQRVGSSTGFELHNNALYPALRRFEEAGAVSKTLESQQGRPPRHVYAITAVGLELLHDLLADFPAERAHQDAEFLTRVGQFERLSTEERAAVLDARAQALLRRAEHLRDMCLRAHEHSWSVVVLHEMLHRVSAEQAWLEQLSEHLDDPAPLIAPSRGLPSGQRDEVAP
jgi:DNA-binding PadR family transcriptional regulator